MERGSGEDGSKRGCIDILIRYIDRDRLGQGTDDGKGKNRESNG